MHLSQLVFGDQKAAYLLPWRRLFNITDAQVFVARRDNARAIFRAYLEREGGDLPADRHFLRRLREQQQAVKLMDDTASEVRYTAADVRYTAAEVRYAESTQGLGYRAYSLDPSWLLSDVWAASGLREKQLCVLYTQL
jgi:hypothetical protein